MKKRLISVMLTVCIVAALFSGLSVTASADNKTVEHTLERGETVIGVCQKLGIDFYANYKWITETNKIANYGNLKPGMKLILPAPGTIAGSAAPGAPAGGTPATPGTMNKGLLPGDYVQSYLIPHVMQRGETVGGVCAALGIDFASNAAQIQRINNIQDFRRIYVGRTIMLPSAQAPASGSGIALVAHKVVSGDAMYNICQSYGIDYASSLKQIQMFNGRTDNFSNIKVGQTILLPVSAVFVQNNGGGSNAGGNGGGNANPSQPSGGNGGSSKPEENKPEAKSYKITKLTTNHGSFEVPATAKAGETVTVKSNPAWTYQTGTITVTCGSKNIPVNDGKFVMPEGNVKVNVSFISEETHTIYRGEAKNGRFSTSVNGNIVDKAVHTQVVHINTEAVYGYELDKITVSYNSGKNFVTLRSDGTSFVMPDHAVKVDVTFKQSKAHAITVNAPNGSVKCKINNTPISEAHSGDTVKLSYTPDEGYKFAGVTVTQGGYTVAVNSNSFIMPAGPVTVDVKFAKDVYNVNIEPNSYGSISVDHTAAEAGDTVNVTVNPAKNYAVKRVTANGVDVAISGTTGSFTMPANDVTVRAEFMVQTRNLSVFKNGNGSAKSSNSTPAVGETVTIEAIPDKGWELDSIVATTAGGENVSISNNSFKMPADSVNVTVNFKAIRFNITVIAGTNGTASADKTSAVWTEEVTISHSAYGGGELASITATDANGNNVPVDQSTGKFKMPCANVTVNVSFRSAASHGIANKTVGNGTYDIKVDGSVASTAKASQTVSVDNVVPDFDFELDSISVKSGEKNVPVNGRSFTMPNADVVVTVTFKAR